MPIRNPDDLENDPRFKDLMERMPARLYKYSGISGKRRNRVHDLIVESSLYFARPSSFNDPFDSKIPVSYAASELVIKQF